MQDDDPAMALPGYGAVMRAAMLMVGALVLTFGGWAMGARLDAAFVTSGVLHSDSERKTVDSLEGGILAEILVRPGDRVTAGQVVGRLDATQVMEQIAQLEAEREQLLFDIWRLDAERSGHRPRRDAAPGPADGIPPDRQRLLEAETLALFDARLHAHEAQVEALERQIGQLEGEIVANAGLADAAQAQLRLWTAEHEIAEKLIDRGAVPRIRLLELERAMAAARGTGEEKRGLLDAADNDIARARAEIRAMEDARQADIAQSLIEARTALIAVESRLRASRDIKRRHALRAPQTGRVVDISLATPGAVLGSGMPLMSILPENDRLVALVQAPPSVIDNLQLGDAVEVRLVAYRRVDVPTLPGTISFISADQLEDERTGASYFELRVALDEEAVADLEDARLHAGMPVEITVTLGSRRAGDYLLEPILRFTRHALTEE